MPEFVTGNKAGNIYTISLNRPEKRNAIHFDMLTHVARLAEEIVHDPEVRAILVTGEGPVFSAGIDFGALAGLSGRFLGDSAAGGASIRADIHKFQQYLNTLESIELPVICVMHGASLGLAMELALACDIRIMAEDCQWGLPEGRFGLIPDLGGTTRLCRTIGASRAMEVIMTGRRFEAGQALAWGLVNHVLPDRESAMETARDLVAGFSEMGPIAVGAVKKVICRGGHVDMMTQLDMEVFYNSLAIRTEDFQEGIKALLEKRDPEWKRK